MQDPHSPAPDPGTDIWPVIIDAAKGDSLSSRQHRRLLDWELSSPRRAAAWQISQDTGPDALTHRLALLRSLCQKLDNHRLDWPLPGAWQDWIAPLWTFWLPLAQRLDRQQRALGSPFIQGILGGQGTGKTTLTQILRLILEQLGHQSVGLSIDDLYLSYAQRCELQRQNPQLIWRGPPGTHDIDLGISTLNQIKHAPRGTQITLPRFDKSLHQGQGDQIAPNLIALPTIVLFEGWFVGARPLTDSAFADECPLPEPIVTPADRRFARDCNQRLHDYLPLWTFLDSLIVLYSKDYRSSKQWRQQAERQMRSQQKPGLSDTEVADFVTYFWRALHPQLFITPLTRSSQTDLVVNIGSDHRIDELYSPAAGHFESAS
jgi:D-glycerate 3-kinase